MCNISENCYNDDQQGYVVVIWYSISVEVLIVSCICWEKQIYYSQVSFQTLKVGDMTDTLFSMTISINVQHPLHKKAKFIHPVNCRSLIYKQNGNSQLLLDTLRVLGIILQHTLFRPVYMEGGCPG